MSIKSVLTARRAADRLAVSPRSLLRLVHAGELPAFRIGAHGPLRFRAEDVERLLVPVNSPDEDADLDTFITTNTKG